MDIGYRAIRVKLELLQHSAELSVALATELD